MAKGARAKKEISMKDDTRFRGKWYSEEDLKDKLLDKFLVKGLKFPEGEDIEKIIEMAYDNDIKL